VAKPTRTTSATFQVDSTRILKVDRGEQIHPNTALYFHYPLFAFEISPKQVNALPRTVFARRVIGSAGYFTFRIVLSSQQLRERSKREVLNDPTERIFLANTPLENIHIFRWPVYSLFVKAVNRTTDYEYGSGRLDAVDQLPDSVDIIVRVQDVPLFEHDLSAGEVKFIFSGLADAVIEKVAFVSVKNAESIEQTVTRALTSDQLKGAPLFQWEADRVTQQIRSQVRVVMATTDPTLLANLEAAVPQRIFERPSVIDFDKLGNERAKVDSYLKALVDTQKTTAESTNTKTTTQDKNLGLKLVSEVLPISVDDKNRIEEVAKISLIREGTTNNYVPHTIATYHLAKGWQQAMQEYVKDVYVRASTVDLPIQLGVANSDFTTEKIAAYLDRGEFDSSAVAIPLGTMLCYLGAGTEPPRGFAWANGLSTWDAAPWVPEHLRGKRVPDMSEMLVGGANVVERVGVPFDSGLLKVPSTLREESVDVEVSGLSNAWILTFKSNRPLFNPVHQVPSHGLGGPLVGEFREIGAVKYTARRYNEGDRVVRLNDPSTNPRHVPCRWIIRMKM